jgi:trk system potassium uptake protein
MNLDFNYSPVSRSINWGTIVGVLGAFTFIIGATLLLPIIIALHFGESAWEGFLVSAIVAMIVGAAMYLLFKPKKEVQLRDGFILVTVTWFFLSVFGALPFYIDGTLPGYTDAFFETISGFTTTGATILGGTNAAGVLNPNIEEMPKSILFWRSMTHWIGGMGFIVLSIAILPLLGTGGMQLFSAESSLMAEDKITPRFKETAKFLWFIYVGLTLLHFLTLWIHPSLDWFDSLNHALSTLATGGFSTLNDSVGGFQSAYIDINVTVFMFLAGVNFVLYLRMLRGEFSIVKNNRELQFYTIFTISFIILISLSLWNTNDYSIGDAFRYGAFQTLAILTTTGYGTDNYLLWGSLPLLLLTILFFTGASTGSTSGGIKMIRWFIILKDILLELKQRVHPSAVLPLRVGQTVLKSNQVRTILAFLMFYLLIFVSGALFLAMLGFDLPSAFGASIACLGNIGPAFGSFGPVDNYAEIPNSGKWMLSFLMLIGRLELFTVLVLFTPSFWRK